MTTAFRPITDRQTGSMRITGGTGIVIDRPTPSHPTPVFDRAAADRRLAALTDELTRRDALARAEREARRPALWLAAMTLSAVALAQLAIVVMLAPL